MKINCCICGREEDNPEGLQPPVVCDRPECGAKAREIGWALLLEQYIEAKRGDDGKMMFRMRPPA